MKAVVFTLGCKVNEVESASIMSALEGMGWEVSDRLCPADIFVLNTCAVTREAEKKSRQLIARARKFSPQASIYVCGCASQKNGEQFSARGVKFICGARDKERILSAIASDFGGECASSLPYPKQVRTRAFIKIEDGCNNFCSYCVIPYLRGRVSSRPVGDIVEEVKNTAADEIVLTGINISAYGTDTGTSLQALICALEHAEKRIRLGSLECNVIDENFLAACKNLHDFAPQFHLSLQSGSNAVLKSMNRHYTREQYLEKCALIYKFFPQAAITTDIIVGFCGETESDFSQSLSIIDAARFARVHAFAFSPREGTVAYSMKDIPAPIKDERLHTLLKKAEEVENAFISSRVGLVRSVIFEDFDGEYTGGYTPEYIKVYVRGRKTGRGDVKILTPFRDGALGEII
mgnify:FL=1